MRDTQRANYIFIIGFVVSVLVVTGGALVFSIPDISQWPGNHHQNNLPVSSSTSLPDQPASLDDWVAYQHVDLPLKYMYPRNWVHEEGVLKGIGPKTFQIYPVNGSPVVIYVTFLDDQSYENLDAFQSTQEQVREFRGSFSRISFNGIDALDETFAKDQYRGGPWTARRVFILYNGMIVEFELQLEYDMSHQDEQAARAILDSLLNSVLLSR